MGPDVNASDLEFYIIDNEASKLVFPLNRIKNVGKAGDALKATAPYNSFIDFFERVDKGKVNKRVVLSLIFAGAFDRIGWRRDVHVHVIGQVAVRAPEVDLHGKSTLVL